MATIQGPTGIGVGGVSGIPLSMGQVSAAGELYQRSTKLAGWRRADRALFELKDRFPDFDQTSVLLKAVAVNSLYSANVLAIQRMAEHVAKVISKTCLKTAGVELVEQLSQMREGEDHHRSFASKFCRFFVDHERFPTWDSYAITMIGVHSGLTFKPESYPVFLEHFQKLKILAGFDHGNPELDRYLWLAGQHRAFKKDQAAEINGETRRLFQDPTAEEKGLLTRLEGGRLLG